LIVVYEFFQDIFLFEVNISDYRLGNNGELWMANSFFCR